MQYSKYENYKPSGIPFAGNIPAHWEVIKSKFIFKETIKKGYEQEPLLAATQEQGVVLKSLLDYKTVLALKDLHLLKLVNIGDFVISLRSFQGGIEYAYHRGIISPAYTILTPASTIHKHYYRFLLKAHPFISILSTLTTGIREGQNINIGEFKNLQLPVPPLSEQIAIATYLDRKLSDIDTFIAKKQRLVTLLQEQKAAMINKAVTKGLNKGEMRPSGIAWLGDIPAHWEVRKLKYVAETLRGKFTPRPRHDPKYYDGNYPFIQTGNISAANKYITTYNQTLNELGKEVSKEFPPNTVVMSIAANIADVAILTFNACFPDSIVGFKPFKIVAVDFLYYQLKNLRNEFYRIATKNTQYNLNVERVQNVLFILPPLSEQIAIVSHIETESARIDKAISLVERELTLVQEYRTALIAEAVTGKIKCPDVVAD